MTFFGICFILYFFKLSAGFDFWSKLQLLELYFNIECQESIEFQLNLPSEQKHVKSTIIGSKLFIKMIRYSQIIRYSGFLLLLHRTNKARICIFRGGFFKYTTV